MKKKSRVLSSEEGRLWENFVSSITPIEKKDNLELRKLEVNEGYRKQNIFSSNTKIKKDLLSKVIKHEKKPLKIHNFSQIDRKTLKKVKNGQINPEAFLDLHGMNVETAYQKVKEFLSECSERNKRLILIITGKGKRKEQEESFWMEYSIGVLKKTVPNWLREKDNNSLILGYTTAHKKHGGEGALYIYLRRNRNYKT